MFLKSLNISASGLTAQQYRLNLISQNLTNIETTRTEGGDGPYRRKTPVFQSINDSGGEKGSFRWRLKCAMENRSPRFHRTGGGNASPNRGVRVVQVIEDPTPGKMVYDPEHPDADENGYVEMPNVETLQEIVDMMGASRSYEANVQAFNAMKAMAQKALELGR